MSLRFAALAVLLVVVSACSSSQERLFDDGAYEFPSAVEGAMFEPGAADAVIELVWLSEGTRYNPAHFVGEQPRCHRAGDPRRCSSLLLQAVADLVEQGFRSEDGQHTFDERGVCVNCEVVLGYLFVVSDDTASVISQTKAIEAFGVIDTPGEAAVVLGEFVPARSVQDGFELVATSEVCNPDGPRRTTWTVGADRSITRGVDWMENAAQDCHDI